MAITIQIMGGLGNQLFQHAYGEALSARYKAPLVHNLNFFQTEPAVTYQLPELGIQTEISNKPFKASKYPRLKLFAANYLPNLATENMCLNGYWQGEKWFTNVAPKIRQQLQAVTCVTPAAKNWLQQITTTKGSVSIHVRRGDYINHPLHEVCTMDYYHNGIQSITAHSQDLHFYVFSDEPEWCKAAFSQYSNLTVVDNVLHAVDEMLLMSHCEHNIICNSTFSWWAAWLREKPSQQTLAPSRWFNDTKKNRRWLHDYEIIPNRWQTIPIK